MNREQIKAIYRQLERFNEINVSDYPMIKSFLKDHLTACKCGSKLIKKCDAVVTFNDDDTFADVSCLDNIWYECESCYTEYDLTFERLNDVG